MKTKSTLLIAFLLGIALQLNAQQTLTCQHPNTDTESLKQIKSLLDHSQKSTDRKIIPVVFHVLHQYGSENISDLQILDALENLNADFQKLNNDTTLVTAPFDTILGDVNFEFRLATIDPNGNPTNGINRIFSSLTNRADENSMIYEWDPDHYVNIWVVKTLNYSGIAGFSTNPLSDADSCTQGIVLLDSYVGSIGTAGSAMRHFLTHEMGHYFGLFDLTETESSIPSNNDCGYSDGIFDTPHHSMNYVCSIPQNSCNDSLYAESFNYWGYDVPDMYQNFMVLGYCRAMFTKGQVTLMRSVAESPLYGRDQLWTPANLAATGTAGVTPPASTAVPSSDFGVKTHVFGNTFGMFTCVGDSVSFLNASGQGNAVSYQWSFPGGSPSGSTLANPKTAYMNPGYYDVTLTVTNANGSSTTTKSSIVYVSGSWPEYTGPTVQNFDQSGNFWQSENVNNDSGYFQRIPTSGTQNSGCFLLGNHYETDTTNTTNPCFADPMQIHGNKDNLVSPAFDLSNTTGVTVSFDYAYGSAAIPDSATEVLKIYYSRDCGKTWIQKNIIIEDTALITAFAAQNSAYTPAQNHWKHVSFPHTSTAMDTKTRFKFEFVASNYSNNFYFDNFVIDGVLGISDNELSGVSIFPNPSQKGGTIGISGLSSSKADLTIRDIQGKLVYQKELSGNEAELNTNLQSGCYLVEITQNGSQFLTRLIIE